MKRFLLFINLCLMVSFALEAQSSSVTLEISDGIQNESLKSKMERNASALLSRINNAYLSNIKVLNQNGLAMTEEAKIGLSALWENAHFYVDDECVVSICVSAGIGQYQVRQIPLMITPQHESLDEEYQEAVIMFNSSGTITRVNFSIATNLVSNVMKKGLSVEDARRRNQILSYVEQFRTAYNEKNIQFMEDVFSEDALIITGSVVKRKPNDGGSVSLTGGDVKYTKYTKEGYINHLKKSFASNSWINVVFDELKCVLHPKQPTMKDFYGVTVRQHYSNSRGYSDDGYLFMIWDFRDEQHPQIHVRTWQPYWLDDAKTQSLPKEDVFRCSDFELEL